MMLRTLIAGLALVVSTFCAAAQNGDRPITALPAVLPMPPGSFSVGLVGSGVFPIVTSDVVGPDSPEGSHKRTTITIGMQGGIEAAWEVFRSPQWIASVRGRYVFTTAFDGETVVHQHLDPVTVEGVSYIVTTDHGVRHVVQRNDVQILLGIERPSIPVRILAGVGSMIRGADVVEETYHELSRVPVVPIKIPMHGDETSAIYKVTGRTSVLVGAELPLRYKRLEVAVHALADLGFFTTVENAIPTTSHLLSAGITALWRF